MMVSTQSNGSRTNERPWPELQSDADVKIAFATFGFVTIFYAAVVFAIGRFFDREPSKVKMHTFSLSH